MLKPAGRLVRGRLLLDSFLFVAHLRLHRVIPAPEGCRRFKVLGGVPICDIGPVNVPAEASLAACGLKLT